MKTNTIKGIISVFILILLLILNGKPLFAQELKQGDPVLDQNISLYAENESLAKVIEQICDYFGLDYSYNSKLIEGKNITLNISNKPIRYVLDKLMEDFYLIFEIENNMFVVRDYVPLSESVDYEKKMRYEPSKNRFEFRNRKDKSVSFSFKSASNLIIIPVLINESDTLNFILDTGVRFPIITELPFVNKLSLNLMRPVSIKGLGEGDGLTAYRSGNNTMKIDGLVAWNQEVHMILNDNFQISQIIGIPVHGLIGFDLFKDFVVEIDYNREKVTVIKPEHYNERIRNKDIIMPLHFEHNKPFVRTTIMTDKGEEVPVKLLVDTGASDAVWLSTKSDDRIGLPKKNIETFLGKGLSGDLYGTKGRIGGIWVGPLVLPEPIVAFPQNEMIEQLIVANDRNGTLGAEILRRFHVTMDYPNHQLRLRSTSKVNDEFNYNMSGLEVSNPMPGLPIFTINNIREDSPGFHAGLKENDQILSVNNTSHRSLSLNDINLLFQSKENRKIRMKVLREGTEIKTSFQLEKVF